MSVYSYYLSVKKRLQERDQQTMSAIPHYVIAEGEDAGELQSEVYALLRDGYTLQGGVSVSMSVKEDPSGVHDYHFWFCQALVKHTRKAQ